MGVAQESVVDDFLGDEKNAIFLDQINKKINLANREIKKNKWNYGLRSLIAGFLVIALIVGGSWGGSHYVFILSLMIALATKRFGIILLFLFFTGPVVDESYTNPISIFLAAISLSFVVLNHRRTIKKYVKTAARDIVVECYNRCLQYVHGEASFGKKKYQQILDQNPRLLSRFVDGDVKRIDDDLHINLSDNVFYMGAHVTTEQEGADFDGKTSTYYSYREIAALKFKKPRFTIDTPIRIELQRRGVARLFSGKDAKMENQEFEKDRDVYCEDPLLARTVVTSAVMGNFLKHKPVQRYKFVIYKDMIFVLRHGAGSLGMLDLALKEGWYRDAKKMCVNILAYASEDIKILQLMNIDYFDQSGSLLTK